MVVSVIIFALTSYYSQVLTRDIFFNDYVCQIFFFIKSLMAECSEQVSQVHEMCYHDLEIMSSYLGCFELGVHSTSVKVVLEPKIKSQLLTVDL